jgi:thiamine biosynthesis lipoprotein
MAAVKHLAGLRGHAQDRFVRSELTVARRAMACEFSIVFPGKYRGGVDAGCAALDEVERLERKLSVYLEESELSELNRRMAEGAVRVDEELYRLLRWAACLSVATGGAFDPAGGTLVKAWGFYRGPKRVPSEAERTAALACSGATYLTLDDERRTIRSDRTGLEFNLGAIGKGYAIDRALHVVQAIHGMGSALMQGGRSSVKGIGGPWTVEIGDPLRPDRSLARVRLRDRALGTSGADHQYFMAGGKRFGHVLDPRTGWPATGLASASAVARTAAEADALSTAFFVMGVEETRRFCQTHPEIGAILVAPGTKHKPAAVVHVIGAVDAEVTV